MKKSIFIASCLMLLNACSRNDTPPTPKLFSESRAALDKAKALEGMLQQQNTAQQKSLDEQTQ